MPTRLGEGKKIEALKREKEERERASMTFRPNVSRGLAQETRGDNPAKSTIHERLYKEAEVKKNKKKGAGQETA